MRIEAELDLVHSDRLKTLQGRLNKPLPEVLGIAIDAALNELAPEPTPGKSSLYEALESIGSAVSTTTQGWRQTTSNT